MLKRAFRFQTWSSAVSPAAASTIPAILGAVPTSPAFTGPAMALKDFDDFKARLKIHTKRLDRLGLLYYRAE
jgi:hypothetical protein